MLYLVDIGDELPLSGHVDLLIVGPHLALNSEKQHFQVPFLSKSKHRENSHKHDSVNFVPSRGEIHLLLKEKTFYIVTILKAISLWSDLCEMSVRQQWAGLVVGPYKPWNMPNSEGFLLSFFCFVAACCCWDLYLKVSRAHHSLLLIISIKWTAQWTYFIWSAQ